MPPSIDTDRGGTLSIDPAIEQITARVNTSQIASSTFCQAAVALPVAS